MLVIFCKHMANFYPRPPRGGRPPITKPCSSKDFVFLSTPSARRATVDRKIALLRYVISIHALREEGDVFSACHDITPYCISIHALREEGDNGDNAINLAIMQISIHALREEGDCGPASGKRP